MSEESNNPANPQAPAPPSRATRITRALISLGLGIGVLVFGVFVVQELGKQRTTPALANDFGTSLGMQTPNAADRGGNKGQALQAIGALDGNNYIPIQREKPHPGEIAPFLGTASFRYPPHQQPAIAGEIWEQCTYRQPDADPDAAFDYYNTQARKRGLAFIGRSPTTDNTPGGFIANWSDGSHKLSLTAWPRPSTEPVVPPLRPKTPLEWVVRYSYPENESPRQPTR